MSSNTFESLVLELVKCVNLDLAAVTARLKEKLDVDSAEDLPFVTVKELQQHFGLKPPKARRIQQTFRNGSAPHRAKSARGLNVREAEGMNAWELVDEINLDTPNAPASKVLKAAVNDAPCIYLDESGGIHRTVTKQLVESIVRGVFAGDHYTHNGVRRRLMRVGEPKPVLHDVHPANKNVILLVGGTCDRGLHWAGLSNDRWYLLYYAANETGQVSVDITDPAKTKEIRALYAEFAETDLHQLRANYDLAFDAYQTAVENQAVPNRKVQSIVKSRRKHPLHAQTKK